MINSEPLLYPLFDYLRRHGVPLGVSEYLLVVKTMREGVGIENVNQLRRFCRLLWAKSLEDQAIFDVAFAELIEPRLQLRAALKSADRPIEESARPHLPPMPGDLPPAFDNDDEPKPAPQPESTFESQESPFTFRSLPLNRPWSQDIFLGEVPVKYHLTPYLPLGRREMAGAWRHLRRLQRSGPAEELDVVGTIDRICQTGIFTGPTLQPRRRNQAGLVLLLDQQGSMSPFSLMIEALVDSILRGGLLGRVRLYYFHDCPEGYLFERPGLTRVRPLAEVLSIEAKHNSVLIISDAGAARGDYDPRRVEETRAFLQTLNAYTYRYTWLNPLPQARWLATSSEDIARLVPMFPLEREGLDDAINILRGHPFPPGVDLNG